jgi:hypothetical protein
MRDVNDSKVNENRILSALKSLESPFEKDMRIGATLE